MSRNTRMRRSPNTRNAMADWIHDPKTAPEVFINEFMQHAVGPATMQSRRTEAYRLFHRHFRSGYCWHFAHLLKATFDRGEVCWCAPFGHMVWVDIDGTPYDIEGVYHGEAMYFIPEKYSVGHLDEFRHLAGMNTPVNAATKAELIAIVKQYCKDTGKKYDTSIERYFADNLERRKA